MSKAEKIIEGLGGAGNIVEVEACITRLRTEVKDSSLVNEASLKAAGAHGVLAAGTAVQVIVGPEADTLAVFDVDRWDDEHQPSYNEPLVDGVTLPRRASSVTAIRSARPNALNSVSAWWWLLSPRRLSMCSVTIA